MPVDILVSELKDTYLLDSHSILNEIIDILSVKYPSILPSGYRVRVFLVPHTIPANSRRSEASGDNLSTGLL